MRWGLALLALVLSGCARSPEAKKARYIEAGKRLASKKDYSRAILEFKNAAQVTPKDPQPYYEAALIYITLSDWNNAVTLLKKVIELDPRHTAAQLRLAQIMAGTSDVELLNDANKRLNELLSISPDTMDVLTALAVTEWKLAKKEDAEQHLREAFEKFPDHLSTSVALARIRIANRDFAGAEEILKKTAGQTPPSANSLVALGAFYAFRGRSAEAEQQFRRAIQVDGKHGLALLHLAAIQLRAGKPEEAEQIYKQLSAIGRQYRPLHALFLLESGKTEAAINELEKLWKADPEDRYTRNQYVAALVSSGRSASAEELLTQVLKKNPRDTDALLQRSRLHVNAARYVEAQRDLNQVLHFQRDSAEAHYLLSKVHEARGEMLNQKEKLGQVLQLKPDALKARLELANLHMRSNAAKLALSVLDEAPGAQKNEAPVVAERNWALIASGQVAEAQKAIEQALSKTRTADLLHQDAYMKLGAKRYDEARKSLHEALAKNPEDVRALTLLVRSHAVQKQMAAAVKEVQAYAAQRPKAAPVQVFLGRVLLDSGNRAQARSAYEAAKAADPKLVEADLMLAQLDTIEGKLDQATQRLTGVVTKAGKAGPIVSLWLGQVEEMKRNPSAAIAHYRKVIEANENNAVALNNLAYLLAEHTNQSDEALKHAQKAKELAPENPDYEDTLGWVLYRKGLYDLAVKHLESAAAKKNAAVLKYHLAMAYAKAGNQQRARTTLEDALRVDPNVPEARAAKELVGQGATATK
jgi:tetratricopeptide (TPR) repeat protein